MRVNNTSTVSLWAKSWNRVLPLGSVSVLQGCEVRCQMWVQIKCLPEDDHPAATLTLTSRHPVVQYFTMWITGLKSLRPWGVTLSVTAGGLESLSGLLSSLSQRVIPVKCGRSCLYPRTWAGNEISSSCRFRKALTRCVLNTNHRPWFHVAYCRPPSSANSYLQNRTGPGQTKSELHFLRSFSGGWPPLLKL